jgi:hypothetical protein
MCGIQYFILIRVGFLGVNEIKLCDGGEIIERAPPAGGNEVSLHFQVSLRVSSSPPFPTPTHAATTPVHTRHH